MHHFVESGTRLQLFSRLRRRRAPRYAPFARCAAKRGRAPRLRARGGDRSYNLRIRRGATFPRRIARAIVEARSSGGIATSGRLAEVVWAAVPPEYRHGRIHPATRTFQALRIAVNDELGRAERGIALAAELLAPGGTIAVMLIPLPRGQNREDTLPRPRGQGRSGLDYALG